MKRNQFRLWAMIALIAAVGAVSACSGNNNGAKSGADASPTTGVSPSTSASPADSGAATGGVPEGPAGKYDPPVEITTVRAINPGIKFKEGDSYESNIWAKDFQDALGISIKYKWLVSGEQYQNKMAVTMASGDLPDFMIVDAQQFQVLVQAEAIADLTDTYAKYASDVLKESLEVEASGIKLKAATFNGRIMGIPADGGGQDDAHSLFIRKDWLAKLGLQPPRTMDELYNLALAFTNDDPDGNGKDDTYGLSLDQSLFNGWSGLDGFFNGYHAYPYNPTKGSATVLNFVKGADGKAAWADIQPEVKTALGKLQELFKAGAIYPEFNVIDGVKSAELVTSGKVGITYGAFWVPSWPINNMAKDTPGSDWGIYPIPSVDGAPAKAQSTGGMPKKYIVVSKKSQHPEAPFLLLNRYLQKLVTEKDMTYHTLKEGEISYNLHMYPPVEGGFAEKNQAAAYAVQDAMEKKDPSGLDEEQKAYYEQSEAYLAGDLGQWAAYKYWSKEGVFAVLGQYKQEGRIFQSVYTGNATPTMVARGPALRDEQVQTFTAIIMGAQPVDYFDEWTQKWLISGGQTITDEVNASGQVQ